MNPGFLAGGAGVGATGASAGTYYATATASQQLVKEQTRDKPREAKHDAAARRRNRERARVEGYNLRQRNQARDEKIRALGAQPTIQTPSQSLLG